MAQNSAPDVAQQSSLEALQQKQDGQHAEQRQALQTILQRLDMLTHNMREFTHVVDVRLNHLEEVTQQILVQQGQQTAALDTLRLLPERVRDTVATAVSVSAAAAAAKKSSPKKSKSTEMSSSSGAAPPPSYESSAASLYGFAEPSVSSMATTAADIARKSEQEEKDAELARHLQEEFDRREKANAAGSSSVVAHPGSVGGLGLMTAQPSRSSGPMTDGVDEELARQLQAEYNRELELARSKQRQQKQQEPKKKEEPSIWNRLFGDDKKDGSSEQQQQQQQQAGTMVPYGQAGQQMPMMQSGQPMVPAYMPYGQPMMAYNPQGHAAYVPQMPGNAYGYPPSGSGQ